MLMVMMVVLFSPPEDLTGRLRVILCGGRRSSRGEAYILTQRAQEVQEVLFVADLSPMPGPFAELVPEVVVLLAAPHWHVVVMFLLASALDLFLAELALVVPCFLGIHAVLLANYTEVADDPVLDRSH